MAEGAAEDRSSSSISKRLQAGCRRSRRFAPENMTVPGGSGASARALLADVAGDQILWAADRGERALHVKLREPASTMCARSTTWSQCGIKLLEAPEACGHGLAAELLGQRHAVRFDRRVGVIRAEADPGARRRAQPAPPRPRPRSPRAGPGSTRPGRRAAPARDDRTAARAKAGTLSAASSAT